MSARQFMRTFADALIFKERFDVLSGEALSFLPSSHDVGSIEIGDGTTNWDFKIFLGSTSQYVLFDVGNVAFSLVGVTYNVTGNTTFTGDFAVTGNSTFTGTTTTTVNTNTAGLNVTGNSVLGNTFLADNVLLTFGTGNDITIGWDGTDLDVLAAADDSVVKFGNGTNSIDVWFYGNIATSYLEWDASASEIRLNGAARPRGFNAVPRRYELKWTAGARGKPGINADIQDANEAVRMIADRDFEVLGTNGISASTALSATGGITVTTQSTGNDQVIIAPHLDASQSGWTTTTWATSKSVEWECDITTGASIAEEIIWAGLKLTNTSTTATDNEQAFFRYESGVNDGEWQAVSSIGGTDTEFDTNVVVAVSTTYHLKITIDSSRVARFYINDVLVQTTAALTSGNLIPYIGIQTKDASTADMVIHGAAISKVH